MASLISFLAFMRSWIANHWGMVMLVSILLVLALLFILFRRYLRENKYCKYFKKGTKKFFRDIHVLFEEGNRVRTVWIIIFIVVVLIPSLLYICHLRLNTKEIDLANVFFAFTGYLISILGIFISASVLIVVDRKRTKTLWDYLRVTLDIIKDSKSGDILYIISPTFCAGITEHKRMLDKLYDKMTTSKNNGVIIKCAFLETSKRTENWRYTGDLVNINIDNAMDDNDLHWKMINKFFIPQIEQKIAKIIAEDEEAKNEAKKVTVTNVVNEKLRLIEEYKEKIKKIDQDLIFLNKDYLKYDKPDANLFRGFYATVNVTQGQYYLGSFYHNGEKTLFRGSFFEIDDINDSMINMLDSFRQQFASQNEPVGN